MKELESTAFLYLDKSIHSRCFALNENYLFTSRDRIITIFDARTWQEVTKLKMPWFSHVLSLQLDGPYLIAAAHEETNFRLRIEGLTKGTTRDIHKDELHVKIWSSTPPWRLVSATKIKDAYSTLVSDGKNFYYKAPQASIHILEMDKMQDVGLLEKSTEYCENFFCDDEYIYGLFHESMKKQAYVQIWQKTSRKLVQTIRLTEAQEYRLIQDENTIYISADHNLQLVQKGTWKISAAKNSFLEGISALNVDKEALYVGLKNQELYRVDKKTKQRTCIISSIGYATDIIRTNQNFLVTANRFSRQVKIWRMHPE